MAARAYWKGYLKLSLVTCPVVLYPASSKADKTRFHQINKKTGHRLRQQMVDEETGRVVDKALHRLTQRIAQCDQQTGSRPRMCR